MANVINYVSYSKGTGRNPFLRIYTVAFSGNAGAANSEILDFTKALNPNGLEDAASASFTTSFAPPMIVGATIGGNKAELQIGGNGTAGQAGITFYSTGNTAITSGSYSSAGFPANGSNFGQVIIAVQSAE